MEQNKISIMMRNLFIVSLIIAFTTISCNSVNENGQTTQTEGKVTVTITHVSKHAMSETIELNATSVFLLKTYVKSNTNGYLQEVNVQLGDNINKGKKMFVKRMKKNA